MGAETPEEAPPVPLRPITNFRDPTLCDREPRDWPGAAAGEFLRGERDFPGSSRFSIRDPCPSEDMGELECPQNLSLTAHEGPQQRSLGGCHLSETTGMEASSDLNRQSPMNPKCVD